MLKIISKTAIHSLTDEKAEQIYLPTEEEFDRKECRVILFDDRREARLNRLPTEEKVKQLYLPTEEKVGVYWQAP